MIVPANFPPRLRIRAGALTALFMLVSLGADLARGAPPATAREYDRVFRTYPYSDPNPVATMSPYYPYFRFDGFTNQPVDKPWKVVELANAYVQVLILPEIGGKIWAAIERQSGRPFIYFNEVVKFRDISMRGPWTSGGIEPNYGIIGHTPNCFSPVDYVVRQNPDGSASCIIGTLDLLTRTNWRLEINLPADQACFTTRSFWHNGSATEQPYYTWMNVGLKAAGNLQFIFPGTHYLGHDGRASDWPRHPGNGRDLSYYDQNDFGSYKSYHVFGRLAEFFGGYYHDEDFGMARASDYGDKLGRKIWIWGLSRQGMIWEKLLTDTNGPYVEVQSGRLFNQTAEESSLTPFKHRSFAPYATDTWTESWQPVKGIKGMVSASPWGALNVATEPHRVVIRISPARPLRDKLEVFDGARPLWSEDVDLTPMQPMERIVTLAHTPQALRVLVGGGKLRYVAGDDDVLSRPTEAPADFNWNSTYGHYLQGREKASNRAYVEAAAQFQSCLAADPHFAPALVEMAALANRRAGFAEARDYARRALSIDTYDPGANFQYGVASAGLGRGADAKDAFSVAALSPGWRGAAQTELARVYLREKDYDRALASAAASLDLDRRNLAAIQLQACIARLTGKIAAAQAAGRTLLELDPLNHFARFEALLRGEGRPAEFTSLIRNELPHETYLELAIWYHGVGLEPEAARVLDLAPPTPEVLYWLAYLRRDASQLTRAAAASPALAFPFRPESIPVFEWAGKMSPAWQPRYYLALIRWSQGELNSARELMAAASDEPRFAPFYAARAQLIETTAPRDLGRAVELDPAQWRYGVMLAKHHLAAGHPAAALPVASRAAQLFPGNDVVTLLHAKLLVATGQHQSAVALLANRELLPCEGSTDARATLREAYLMLALAQMRTGAFAAARPLIAKAREWPENLGAGKPYAEDLDERLEDWLEFQCVEQAKGPGAQVWLDKILAFGAHAKPTGAGPIIRALALKARGKGAEAEQLLRDWRKLGTEAATAQWGRELLTGHPADLPAAIQDSDCRVLAAWAKQVASR